jgi:hypothetical protein
MRVITNTGEFRMGRMAGVYMNRRDGYGPKHDMSGEYFAWQLQVGDRVFLGRSWSTILDIVQDAPVAGMVTKPKGGAWCV